MGYREAAAPPFEETVRPRCPRRDATVYLPSRSRMVALDPAMAAQLGFSIATPDIAAATHALRHKLRMDAHLHRRETTGSQYIWWELSRAGHPLLRGRHHSHRTAPIPHRTR